jgi:thioredoxin reductase
MWDADVGVVGAGYAGLAAALFLRRHRVSVVVFDGGPTRNHVATEVHGYLGLPSASATELIAVGRGQVEELGGRIEACRIERAEVVEDGFRLAGVDNAGSDAAESGGAGSGGAGSGDAGSGDAGSGDAGSGDAEWRVRRLLLATGVRDLLPDIARFDEFYGRSVHVCPHCDGYEWRDQPIAVISWNDAARDFVSKVSHWSRDVTLVSDGRRPEISAEDRAWLGSKGIALRTATIQSFEGDNGRLDGLRLVDGDLLPAAAAFFSIGEEHQTGLAKQLDCRLDDSGAIDVDDEQHTSVEGVWAAGDVAGDSQFVAIAAAHGVKAALDIHRTLATREPERHRA